jgi:hypothetical protein
MDNRAKLHRAETAEQPRELQRTIPGEPWAFWVKDTQICMNLHAYIATATRGTGKLELLGDTRQVRARRTLRY